MPRLKETRSNADVMRVVKSNSRLETDVIIRTALVIKTLIPDKSASLSSDNKFDIAHGRYGIETQLRMHTAHNIVA